MSAAFSDLPLSSQLAVEGNWSNDPDGLNLPSSQAADGVPGRNARRVAAARARNKPQNIPKKVDTLAENFRVNFEQFLEAFEEETESGPVQCYLQQISNLRRFEKTTVYIDFGHLYAFDGDLAKLAKSNYFRLEPYMKRAVQNLVLKYDPEYVQLHTRTNAVAKDSVHREFWISFYNLPAEATHRLRELKTSMIGELVAIKGTVTRTSAVQPELMYGTFQCKDCLTEIKDVEQQFKYTEPTTCPNYTCMRKSDFTLLVEQSKFTDFQKLRVQENSEEIPTGAMPRSMDVMLRNEIVEQAKAGDRIIFSGTPIVIPDVGQLIGQSAESHREPYQKGREGYGSEGVTGLKALGVRDLTYRIVFVGNFVRQEVDKTSLNALHDLYDDAVTPEEIQKQFDEEHLREFMKMRQDRHLYHKLISSFAPHIFGHEDIKKGILLQLLGGVHKSTEEGISLRGDINICIVGDPSTAKSQFLKYTTKLMPRAIYTSGKASSAAGLTASVMKDEETGEFTIEAGALMLADNGICCIDEFDKMDIVDQVAIHEAMEQQTISIAKAGIQATLNARTSILAAANPIRGRYDKKLSLKQNINMSPPIMSRFDLFFVILDECNQLTDMHIARHIVNFHRFQEEGVQPEYPQELMLKYLQYAKALKPQMTPEAREFLVEKYRELRSQDTREFKRAYTITVRQLESMIRLSEALAKLYCHDHVEVGHVQEAYKLLKTSVIRVIQDDVSFDENADESAELMLQPKPMEVVEREDGMDMDAERADGQPSASADGEATQPKQPVKFSLPAAEYDRITKQIILKINQNEKRTGEEGMRRSEIIEWYLEEREKQMESQEDFHRETKVIKAVLVRMIKKEKSLLVLKAPTDIDAAGEPQPEADPLLAVHPNCRDVFYDVI